MSRFQLETLDQFMIREVLSDGRSRSIAVPPDVNFFELVNNPFCEVTSWVGDYPGFHVMWLCWLEPVRDEKTKRPTGELKLSRKGLALSAFTLRWRNPKVPIKKEVLRPRGELLTLFDKESRRQPDEKDDE